MRKKFVSKIGRILNDQIWKDIICNFVKDIERSNLEGYYIYVIVIVIYISFKI